MRKRLYEKINQVAREELAVRIARLGDGDLGLAMRAMSRLDLREGNWGEIVEFLGKRLPSVKSGYAVESVFEFLLCLPPQQ